MEIKKTVITAAGQNQRTLPLQTLVDGNGQTKSALAIIVEESLQAGIEEICVVVSPGDQAAYRAAAGPYGRSLQFVEQSRPLGYGHAVWCAREFTGASPFLLLVGDHLYLSRTAKRCAQQLVETAAAEACTVSAVQATHESKLPYYGTVGGRLAGARPGLYLVSDVVEKPTPTQAEQTLIVPGLRTGYYLCFFGMHVLMPRVMALLGEEAARAGETGRVQLSATLSRLVEHERYLACELEGRRFDIGEKYGLLTAQLALALNGRDRDEILSGLVELLALGGK
jgi:UTP--glucose-1-phosphate uridylyltransferase